jgi:Uma2 family endonuclease
MRSVEPGGIRYVRPVRPVDFPASDPEWEMGESKKHQLLCDLLKQILAVASGAGSSVGCDQFIYFDASNPKRKCAPDAFVKLDVPDEAFETWKIWEKGTPELCVEVLSPSDAEKLTLEEKLARFHAMGVAEVVAFDVEAPAGRRIRAWDLVDGDLVERIVESESTPCRTLGLWFVIAPCAVPVIDAALRLAEDAGGARLVLSPLEGERAEKDAAIARERAALEENARLREELSRALKK